MAPKFGHIKGLLVVAVVSASASTAACAGGTVAPPRAEAVSTAPDPTPEPEMRRSVTIAAVGDIMLASPFPEENRMPPNDGADLLKHVTHILSAADIAFGNMEAPIIDEGISEKCGEPKPGEPIRCYAFRMPTRYAKYLKDAGFDILSLANNHASDFGEEGRVSTRKTLDALGLKHAGSDRWQYSTAVLEVRGTRVAFVAFAHNDIVPNINDLASARVLVSRAARSADIVVVSFHGGAEGSAHQNVPWGAEMFAGEKRGNLRQFSRTVIDAGADLVLGHGPHVLRGMEMYKGRLIAYSLGNFATYGWFRLQGETALTMILEAELAADGTFVKGKIHSGKQIDWGVPVMDPTGAAIKKVRSLSRADFGSSTPVIGDDGAILPS